MIFVIPWLSYARAISGEEISTPWRRWFAWYPINDMGVVYWLTHVEWRVVIGRGYLREDGVLTATRHYEYRYTKITTRIAGTTND